MKFEMTRRALDVKKVCSNFLKSFLRHPAKPKINPKKKARKIESNSFEILLHVFCFHVQLCDHHVVASKEYAVLDKIDDSFKEAVCVFKMLYIIVKSLQHVFLLHMHCVSQHSVVII